MPARVVHTVSRLSDLTDLLDQRPDARLVLERATSMLRHGMSAAELRRAGDVLRERRRGTDGRRPAPPRSRTAPT